MASHRHTFDTRGNAIQITKVHRISELLVFFALYSVP